MRKLLQKLAGKNFFFTSLLVAGYFCLLCLNTYVIKSDFILIEILQELLTLPLIVFQFVLLGLSISYCIKDKFRLRTYSFGGFLILFVSNLFVLISFI